eukprot:gene9255-11341_t
MEVETTTTTATIEVVNHPDHNNMDPNIEALSQMAEELSFNIDSFKKFLVLDTNGIDDEYDHTIKVLENYKDYQKGISILRVTSKGKIAFSEINEIRLGHQTNIFQSYKIKNKDENLTLSYSVLFGKNNTKSLDFICKTIEERRQLVSSLYHLVNSCKLIDNEYSFVKREWDAVGKLAIDLPTLKKILSRLNYTSSDNEIAQLMQLTDANSDCVLDFTEFSNLLKLLRRRKELSPILSVYSNGKEYLTIEDMIKFFRIEQNEDWTVDQCQELIIKYHRQSGESISMENFEEYLTSDSNEVTLPFTKKEYQANNRPITDYYIHSSHNTYLAGHQLKGLSTTEMYTTSLRSGCRCVELDVWDGADGEPIIFHGKTLTSQIKFSNVLETIKQRAFETSPYPVTLSMEIHCSIPQQIRMAHHFKEILGDMLPKPLLNENPDDYPFLPTLEQLKYKILIKGHVNPKISPDPAISPDTDATDHQNSEEESDEESSSPSEKKKKTPKAKWATELTHLVYLKSSGYKGAKKFYDLPPWEMVSLSEAQINDLKSESEDLVKMNQKHLTKVYPKGTRFDSSNCDPTPGWNIGGQFICLNLQTSSTPMWLNNGLFEDNGGVGYVLKPPCLLAESSNGFDPYQPIRHHQSLYSKLIVEVISARQLPKYTKTTKGEVIDPFITLSIHGCSYDEKEHKTKVIDNNGFNPYWGEIFEFNLVNSQLDYLLIRVDDKDKFKHNRVGHFCIRVENIRPGYRIVKFKNDLFNTIPLSNLLCKFTLFK